MSANECELKTISNKSEDKCNIALHVWRIPSIPDIKKNLLCSGFSRYHYKKYITESLIQLIAVYFTNDLFTLKDMQNAQTKKMSSFHTSLVSIQGIKFYLQINIPKPPGKLTLLIRTPRLHKPVVRISAKYMLSIEETNEENQQPWTITGNQGHKFTTFENTDIQKVNTFTIKLRFSQLLLYNQYDCIIHQNNQMKLKAIQLPINSYMWTLCDPLYIKAIKYAYRNQRFTSPIFKYGPFNMALVFTPHYKTKPDVVLYFRIFNFPQGVSKLCFKSKYMLQETDTKYINDRFTLYEGGELVRWSLNTLYRDKIMDLNQFTFTTNFTLYDVLDKNGYAIKNYMENLSLQNTKLIELKSGQYIWNIYDIQTLKDMKRAKNRMCWISNLFAIGPFKWFIIFCPNGATLSNVGQPWVKLRLLNISPHLSKAIFGYNITIICQSDSEEIYTGATSVTATPQNMMTDSAWESVNITRQKLQNATTLKFCINITVCDLFDKYGIVIRSENFMDKYKLLEIKNFPLVEYEWKIRNPILLKQMKYAPNVFGFAGPIFEAFRLKWFITLYPNASTKQRENNVGIGVKLVSLHSKALKVSARVCIHFVETDETFEINIKTANFKGAVWGCSTSHTKPFDLLSLDIMTFKIRIELISVFDDTYEITKYFIGNEYNKCKQVSVASNTYKWCVSQLQLQKLKTFHNGESMKSESFIMHNLKFEMEIYPNGTSGMNEGLTNIMVNLLSDLPSIKTIIYVRCFVCLIEAKKRVLLTNVFYENHMFIDWKHSSNFERLSTEMFNKLNQCTIELNMELIDVYDNGINIIHRYVDLEEIKLKFWL
eukprot:348437_1